MDSSGTGKPKTEGLAELWLLREGRGSRSLAYRPAVIAECALNFRNLRAGLNHSEERTITAWAPASDLAIDWQTPAVDVPLGPQLSGLEQSGIGYKSGDYALTRAAFDGYQQELHDLLVRTERLRINYSPVFELYSYPEDDLDDLMSQVADAALKRVEPELHRLRARFELQLEQIREAQSRRGQAAENINNERLMARNLHLFESENRLTTMFSTLAGTVFGVTAPHDASDEEPAEEELRDDLNRVEQEATEALASLHDEYMALASDHDVLEIGLQPDNIQFTRLSLLWVPWPTRNQ